MSQKLEPVPEVQTPQVAAVNQATLTPLVQLALNSQTIEITSWEHKQLHGGAGGSTVHRFSGKGFDEGQVISWSLILKVLTLPGKGNRIRD